MTLDNAIERRLNAGDELDSIWVGHAAFSVVSGLAGAELDAGCLLYIGLPVHLDVHMGPSVVVLRYRGGTGCFGFTIEGA